MIDGSKFRKNAYEAYLKNEETGVVAKSEDANLLYILAVGLVSAAAMVIILALKVSLPYSIEFICSEKDEIIFVYPYVPSSSQELKIDGKKTTLSLSKIKKNLQEELLKDSVSLEGMYLYQSKELTTCNQINQNAEIYSYKRLVD